MIAESKFDRKKKERKVAALLALSEEKNGDGVRCLTDEEMAKLVDGNGSGETKEQGWAHLSDCQQCYDQWYSLKMEKGRAQKKSGRLHLMHPRNLAIAGSAMAVAASVAVFLNIPQAPFSDQPAEESLPSLQATKETEAPSSPDLEAEMKVDKGVSYRSAPSGISEKMVLELKDDRLATPKKRAKPAAAPQPTRKIEAASDMMAAEMTAGSPDRAQSIELWLEMVREGCMKRQAEMKFWEKIISRGDQLFQDVGQGADKKGEEARAIAVLQLVPRGYDADSITGQCEQILVELAEGEKSM
jgi:hypothetical protein